VCDRELAVQLGLLGKGMLRKEPICQKGPKNRSHLFPCGWEEARLSPPCLFGTSQDCLFSMILLMAFTQLRLYCALWEKQVSWCNILMMCRYENVSG